MQRLFKNKGPWATSLTWKYNSNQYTFALKFGWNWPSGSWDDFYMNLNNIFYCNFIIALSKWVWPFIEQTFKEALYRVWIKLAQWLLRTRFFNFINIFSLLGYYLPLEKGMGLHLNKPELPSPKDALCQVSLKLDQYNVLETIFKLRSCIFAFW